MELIIDFDKIKDPSKREWLITSLKLMHIGFQTSEKPQTLRQYNNDLEKGNDEIEQGKFTTADDLKSRIKQVVVWSNSAKIQLQKAYEYIALDSLKNAQMFRDVLIDMTIALAEHPEKHPLDQFKKDNDGSWRAFEKYHYRVSYRIFKDDIRIVRLRHTSKSPLTY